MQIFKIPIEWAVYGTIEIEAESPEDAIRKFNNEKNDIPTPRDMWYIEDSFKLAFDEADALEFVRVVKQGGN